ncbi:MAG: hypothetical protein HY562_06485 [Ignavibacteriales bacterium]|nr:hypothetical protein [Ignavibacteriales bacterium]
MASSRVDWTTRPLNDELGETLRAEVLTWPGVVARPMMGTLSFYRGRNMIGCYVNRKLFKKKPPDWANRPGEPPSVWVRLRPEDVDKALKHKHVRSLRANFAAWVDVPLVSRSAMEEAIHWLGVAYVHPRRAIRSRHSASQKSKNKPKAGMRT